MRSVLDSAADQIDTANRTPATKAKMAERILRERAESVTASRRCDPLGITQIEAVGPSLSGFKARVIVGDLNRQRH
jgi:hypothetical protein